jgi:hypothetical protein
MVRARGPSDHVWLLESHSDAADARDLTLASADSSSRVTAQYTRASLASNERDDAPTSVSDRDVTDTASDAAAGHSFVRPRARLRRPRPVSNETLQASSDSASHSFVDTSPAANPADRVTSESDQDVRETGLPRSLSPPEASTLSLTSGPRLPETPRAVVEVGAFNTIPRTEEGMPGSEASELSELSDSILSPTESPPVPAEPTMLDRLRGLAPRFDDNTDKALRQSLKWADPFSLLRKGSTPAQVPVDPGKAVEQTAEIPGSTPPPAETATSETVALESSIATAIAEIESELAAWPMSSGGKPEDPAGWRLRQTDLRMLYLVAGRSAESVRVIESLPAEEQEFWQSLMLAVNQYRDASDEAARADELSAALNHLRTAGRRLQPLSRLQIRRLTLCDRIDGFGNVSEYPTTDFDPGQRILIYAEIQNFRSQLTAAGYYQSEFAALIEFLREGDGEVFETIRLPQIMDRCDVERTDFYQSFELTVPALAGKYTVRLKLRDQLSLQTTEAQLEFNVREGR